MAVNPEIPFVSSLICYYSLVKAEWFSHGAEDCSCLLGNVSPLHKHLMNLHVVSFTVEETSHGFTTLCSSTFSVWHKIAISR
uniref:Uncharacterized protein n=1 Tax=Lactuca sativa TaxID=4236 RepID=A0A9R1WEM0_LACSA|nr:hypothetical protein LSAT_V11C200093570 [Lactuca sativa]